MSTIFNPPPTWQEPPEHGWSPPEGWEKDASWPSVPAGWHLRYSAPTTAPSPVSASESIPASTTRPARPAHYPTVVDLPGHLEPRASEDDPADTNDFPPPARPRSARRRRIGSLLLALGGLIAIVASAIVLWSVYTYAMSELPRAPLSAPAVPAAPAAPVSTLSLGAHGPALTAVFPETADLRA